MSSNTVSPGLMFVHSNRSERLRDLIIQWIRRYPLAPLENETVLVQSNGIAQWLKLALAADAGDEDDELDSSGGCGIAAALDLSLPSRFIWRVYRGVLGVDVVPEVSPFDKSEVVWRLVRLLPEILAITPEPEGAVDVYAPLRRFLSEDHDQRKLYQLAGRIADLFDQYQVYRADWLAAWASNEDIVPTVRGEPVVTPPEQHWQAQLWRELLKDVSAASSSGASLYAIEASQGSRAAVHDAFLRAARAWKAERPKNLPRRVIVFGISSLPQQSIEVLVELARWSQVLVCVSNPCEHYWADIVPDKQLLRAVHARQPRRSNAPAVLNDDQLHIYAHPLLAAWGKQGRDFIGLLDDYDNAIDREAYLPQFSRIGQRIDLFDTSSTLNMLEQLQDDIRDLRPLSEIVKRAPVDIKMDKSIRFHITHSPQREVEVLHDQLLAAFNDDPLLLPRDVIVMMPDVAAYAPHIQAVFGQVDREDPRYIPYSVADQGQRKIDPLIGAIESLLALPDARFSVSDLLDLLEVPAVRARFDVAQDDIPTLRNWTAGANIRWGLHAAQRESLGLPRDPRDAAPNTWTFGLRRMLLGYAAGNREPDVEAWHDIEPYAEISGLESVLLGPLVDLLDALEATWVTLRTSATVGEWCQRLRAINARFFKAEEGRDAYTLLRLDGALQAWLDSCEASGLSKPLPLSVVADYWLSQLDDGGLSQKFFAGAVTFATLMPMRAIPFKRVCLLGMNDGDYPRVRIPMDFDLMARHYRPGDRSGREDDRYMLLEAVLSARDHLHISWVGRSVNDNTERPPSVLIGQFRDHLAAGWRLMEHTAVDRRDGAPEVKEKEPAKAFLEALTTEHRLQPFNAQYFPLNGGVAADAPSLFTYAKEWQVGQQSADAGTEGHSNRRDASSGDKDSEHEHEHDSDSDSDSVEFLSRDEPVTAQELTNFLKDPVKAFFTKRLRVTLDLDEAKDNDIEPFNVIALERWKLEDELIRAQVAAIAHGDSPETVRDTLMCNMKRRGELAAGGFGDLLSQKFLEPMDELFMNYTQALARWPERQTGAAPVSMSVDVDGDPIVFSDFVSDLRRAENGEAGRVVLVTGSLLEGDKKKHYRYDKGARYWVDHVVANLAQTRVTTVLISAQGSMEFLPLDAETACETLRVLIATWHQGMRRPLPVANRTAFEWLAHVSKRIDTSTGQLPSDTPEHWIAETLDKASKRYEGGYKLTGDAEQSGSLARAFPDFEALTASGEFVSLALALYWPIRSSIKTGKTADQEEGAETA